MYQYDNMCIEREGNGKGTTYNDDDDDDDDDDENNNNKMIKIVMMMTTKTRIKTIITTTTTKTVWYSVRDNNQAGPNLCPLFYNRVRAGFHIRGSAGWHVSLSC